MLTLLLFLRYIMTSEFTLEPTERFFKENHFFGLNPSDVIMFEQRMIPAVSFDGKVILEKKGKLAMAPGQWKDKCLCVQMAFVSAHQDIFVQSNKWKRESNLFKYLFKKSII